MKNIMNIIPCLLIVIGLLASCKADNKDTTPAEAHETNAVETFTLTAANARQSGIEEGTATMQPFADVVKANGQLKVNPQSTADVASPMGANIKRILVVEGQHVGQGQVLAIVSHPDLLDLQGRYLEAYNRMSFIEQEYKRQKQLYNAKIGSGKELQQITSEYRQLQSQLRISAQQLSLLGINPASIRKGHTINSIAIKSPINGTVERITAQTGQYADPQTSLFSIVNTDHVYADILVYENDIDRVAVGNRVTLSVKTAADKKEGRVVSIGKVFDANTKAVHVRVALSGNGNGLVPGAYASAAIMGNTSNRLAVPEDGLASDGGKDFVFIVKRKGKHMEFTPRQVTTAMTANGYKEVTGGLSHDETIAVSGAYTLMSEWKKADAEQ